MLKDRLIHLRKKTKLRQEDFAKKIGVARTTYAMYEQGNRQPDYDTLLKIADYHNCTTDYLLGKSDEPRLTQKEYDAAYEKYHELVKKLESFPEEKREYYLRRIRDYAEGLSDSDE